tara:strand:- start:307 stop:1446 length:1140 start_codon:yes stop_codon:yes gene_type:complete
MTKHAILSASGSPTWLGCPGSRKAQEGYKNKSSAFAIEGTHAHKLADLCLKNKKDAEFYIGKKVLKTVVEADMAAFVQEYLDYVRAHESKNTELFTEMRVDFGHIVSGGFGTLDAAVMDYDNHICHIFDLKYGKGIQVYAFENTQSQLYALGFLKELKFLTDIKTFRIHIVQPRKVTHAPWDITVEDLQLFAKYATERGELAMTDSAPRVPGNKQCQWCDAKPDCEALAKFCEETIMVEFENLNDNSFVEVAKLSNIQKKAILDNTELIKSFLTAVNSNVFDQINNGKKFPGYKIILGKANRQWSDKAEGYLKRKFGAGKIYTKKLIGIGAAEKLMGKEKKKLNDYTDKPVGSPRLVLESHPSFAVIGKDVIDDFNKIA